MKTAVIYLLAITIAEIVTVTFHSLLGMAIHVVILAAVIAHSAIIGKSASHDMVLSIALVPLTRIISLSMPLTGIPQIWWYPIVYLPLMVATYEVARMMGYKWRDIGVQIKNLPYQPLIAVTGFGWGFAEFFILREEAVATNQLLGQTPILAAIILTLTTGLGEELIFRGVLQKASIQRLGEWGGMIFVSALFAVVHWIHNSVPDILFVFVVALFFAWAAKKSGSLLGVTLAHGIANTTLFLIAPLIF